MMMNAVNCAEQLTEVDYAKELSDKDYAKETADEEYARKFKKQIKLDGISGVSKKNMPLAVNIYTDLCINKFTLKEARELLREIERSFEDEMCFR